MRTKGETTNKTVDVAYSQVNLYDADRKKKKKGSKARTAEEMID